MYTGGQVLANVLALEVHLDSTVSRHLRLGMSVVSSVVPSLKRALPRPLARPRTMDVQRPLQQRLESRRQAGRPFAGPSRQKRGAAAIEATATAKAIAVEATANKATSTSAAIAAIACNADGARHELSVRGIRIPARRESSMGGGAT